MRLLIRDRYDAYLGHCGMKWGAVKGKRYGKSVENIAVGQCIMANLKTKYHDALFSSGRKGSEGYEIEWLAVYW